MSLLRAKPAVVLLNMCTSVSGPTGPPPRPHYRQLPSVQAEVPEVLRRPNEAHSLPAAQEPPLSPPHNYSAGPVKKPETLSLLHYSHTARATA